ncbi:MAG TPA: HU family DNA-binding protein [Desulfomonilaceae bacterium]|nr:HU family DNA-binding protein [Desulfomonilaceae bacterium]
MPWFVYILRCSDNSLYCGTTTDLEGRLKAHNSRIGARYTRSRSPVKLVWHAQAPSKSDAFKEEFRIKRLHKAEKEILVSCTQGGEPEYSNLVGGITMTKAELVSKLAEETKVTKKVAATMLDTLVKTLQTGLKGGGKIRIDGLGTFAVADRKARNGVNPQTKAKIKIPATKAPVFRAAKALKEAVKPVPKKAGKKSKG